MDITYGLLIDFLNDKDLNGIPGYVYTAEALGDLWGVGKDGISRFHNGDEKQPKNLKKKEFNKFEQKNKRKTVYNNPLFATEQLISDYKKKMKKEPDMKFIRQWYKFLKAVDALTGDIKAIYKRRDVYRFLLTIFEEAERNRPSKQGNLKGSHDYEKIKKILRNGEAISFPPFLNPGTLHYVERPNLMKDIKEKLYNQGLAVICGIGGLRKTEASLHYAAIHQKDDYYEQIQQVFYKGSLTETINSIKFSNPIPRENEQIPPDKRLELRLNVLKELPPDSLLIIDNMDVDTSAENSVILKELMDMDMDIIITSRNTKLYLEKVMLPLEHPSEKEAFEIFEEYYFRAYQLENTLPESQKAELENLLRLIDYHTLLIEMIARTLREGCMSMQELYQALLKGEEENLSTIRIEKDGKTKDEKYYRLIELLFKIDNLSDQEKDLLSKLSLSSPDGIRKQLLADILKCNGSSFMDSINHLIRLSWIKIDQRQDPVQSRIQLHPVISTAVRGQMNLKPEDYAAYFDNIGNVIKAALNSRSSTKLKYLPDDFYDIFLILYNANNFFHDMEEWQDFELQQKLAYIYRNLGQLFISFLIDSRDSKQSSNNDTHHIIDHQVGCLLFNIQIVSRAINSYRMSSYCSKKSNPDDRDLALPVLLLGHAYLLRSFLSFNLAPYIVPEKGSENILYDYDHDLEIASAALSESIRLLMQAQRIPFGKYDFPWLLLMRARTYYKDGNEKLRRNQYMEALINFEKNLQIYTLIFSENFPRFSGISNLISNLLKVYLDTLTERKVKNPDQNIIERKISLDSAEGN